MTNRRNKKRINVGHSGTEEFGRLIRNAREAKGMNQVELGERLGVTKSMISKIEAGVRGVTSPESIETLSQVLHLSTDQMFAAQGVPPHDLVELLVQCSRVNIKRARWALNKIAKGEMFDEEIIDAMQVASDLPGDVLVPRKRTTREERAVVAMRDGYKPFSRYAASVSLEDGE